MPITMEDVAKKAGVALSTVSNVFNGKKFVSDEVKQRVLDVCKKLHFKPNFMASSLVTKKTNIIGLFLKSEKNSYVSFYGSLIKGLGEVAERNSYAILLLFNILESNDFTVHMASASLMEGAVILAPQEQDFRIKELKKDGVPMVVIGVPPHDFCDIPYADSDNEGMTYELTLHLLERGHRRIAFLNGNKNYTINIDRLAGFTRAHSDFGLTVDGGLVLENNSDPVAARRQLSLLGDVGFSAVLTESNAAAKGAYAYASDIKKTVGKDFAIVSLGGMLDDEFDVPLTFVYVDYEEIGRNVMTQMLDVMQNKPDAPKFLRNNHRIIYGASSDFLMPSI